MILIFLLVKISEKCLLNMAVKYDCCECGGDMSVISCFNAYFFLIIFLAMPKFKDIKGLAVTIHDISNLF